MTEQTSATMPDFSHATSGFHHTVDSALRSLFALGISPSRITVRMAGRGFPTGQVIEQSLPPGAWLGPAVHIKLTIAGMGIYNALPVGMWDAGTETHLGTREIIEIFDDPLQKGAHWVREGARIFDISAQNQAACARWISLFGLNPNDWPADVQYKLSLFLPHLDRLRGTEIGIRLTLQFLLDLPLAEIRFSRAFCALPDSHHTSLGGRASRLGVDFVLGGRREVLAKQTLVIGPVSLATYDRFRTEVQQALLDLVLSLVLPCHREHAISWRVLDPKRRPRLAREARNTRLGVNFHLGRDR
jgi:hypothetical protein